MKRSRASHLFLFVLVIATTAATTSAQEVTIEDIFAFISEAKVTTATRTERTLRTVPGSVSVVTRAQIEETGATTVGDVLRLVPGLNMRFTAMGSFVGVRSFGSTPFSERVLILIDGVPYNSPDKGGFAGHPAFEDFFPVEHIERIEVVKGPGSALYGQNALQGVINIITRSGSTLGGGEVDFLGGERDTAAIRLTQGGTRGDFQWAFTGKGKQQQGPLEFARTTDFRTGDFYFKTSYKGFGASYLFHRDTFDTFSYAEGTPTPPQSLPTEQNLNLLNLSYNTRIAESLTANVKFLYNRRDGSTCAACHDPEGNGTPLPSGELASPGFIEGHHEVNQRAWLDFQFNFAPAESIHNVTFGGTYQYDRTSKEIVVRRDADPDVTNVAGFVQDEIALAGGNVITTLGARVDQNEYTDTSVSPSASVVYLPTPTLTFRAQGGRAFRQPTWNDLFIDQMFLPRRQPTIAGAPTEFRRLGLPELDTEKVDTIQGGFEWFVAPNAAIKFDAFYSKYRDLIETTNFNPFGFPPFLGLPQRPPVLGPGGATFLAVAENRESDIDVKGIELEVSARSGDRFSFVGSYAYQTDDTDPATDAQAAYAPEHKATAIVNFRPIPRLGINFNMNTWSSFNASRAGLTQGLIDDFPGGVVFGEKVGEPYTIAHLRASFDLWRASQERRFGVAVQLRNVFDETIQMSPTGGVDTSLFGRELFFRVYYHF